MAKDTKKKVSRVKGKRKTWFKVLAPKLFGEKEIGESYLGSSEKSVGRLLKVNLRELTGNSKDQNVYVDLEISSVDGSTLKTSTTGFKLTAAFVKRLVRKNADKVDDFFILKTKEGKEVILKLLVITKNKVQRSVKTELRKKLKELTPSIPIISEETSDNKLTKDLKNFWLVDPIDGTYDYINDLDEFTINAGLIVDRKPVAGLIYAPAKKRMFYSYGEGNAYEYTNGKEIKINGSRNFDKDKIKFVSYSNKINEIFTLIDVRSI